LPDFLRFNLMTSFALEPRFEFVGQNSPSEKPVQGLATLLRAADPNPGRSMPQLDTGAPKETLLNVFL
jgi:hypothetical protein